LTNDKQIQMVTNLCITYIFSQKEHIFQTKTHGQMRIHVSPGEKLEEHSGTQRPWAPILQCRKLAQDEQPPGADCVEDLAATGA
jgi:hypothetical protein